MPNPGVTLYMRMQGVAMTKNAHYFFLAFLLMGSPYLCAMESLSRSSSDLFKEGKRERRSSEESDQGLVPLSPVLKKTKNEDEAQYQAAQVAVYLLKLDAQETRTHTFIDRMKLQKLLYYIQGYSLALNKRSMFTENVIHYTHGPVVWEVLTLFERGYDQRVELKDLPHVEEAPFTDEEKELMATVFELKMHKSGTALASDSHSETPYITTDQNDIMSHDLLESHFRRLDVWLPYTIQRFCLTKTNEGFENLVRYVREYLSYSHFDSLSLSNITDCFDTYKSKIERALNVWTNITYIRWPGQTFYQAFMGYLFLPVQYENNYEILSSETLQYLICISASFGNKLSMHYAIELLKLYSLEEESPLMGRPELQKASEILSSDLGLPNSPLYHTGLLCLCLGNTKQANQWFKKGFEEQKHAWCGYRHALCTRNTEAKKEIIQRLQELDPYLAQLAGESFIDDIAQRVALHLRCAQAGISGSYFTVGLLLEESNPSQAQEMYRLAALHHVLSAYEKLAQLSSSSGESSGLKKIYQAWGLAGDPTGFVKLGELFLAQGDRGSAIRCFNRGGLRGIEKRIEFAATFEEAEEAKKKLRDYIKDMYQFVLAKILTGTSLDKKE